MLLCFWVSIASDESTRHGTQIAAGREQLRRRRVAVVQRPETVDCGFMSSTLAAAVAMMFGYRVGTPLAGGSTGLRW